MATAATSLLGLALPVTGELSGTWGDTVNVSITALLDTAVAGTTTLSSDADVTLTTTTLAANQARQAIILWTAGGTVTRTITAPAQSKSYIVINKTSSSQSIKIVGVGPTTGVTIVAGTAAFVVWNGVDFVTASVTSTTGILPVANGGTGLSSGTSGGVLAYTATGTLASSAALAANALVIGGGAGAAPSTTTTGTGVVTALGVNVGTAGAFVVNGGALGTPSSGTVTNLTGTASININGTVGATTPTTGAFTTLSASGVATFSAVGDNAVKLTDATTPSLRFTRTNSTAHSWQFNGGTTFSLEDVEGGTTPITVAVTTGAVTMPTGGGLAVTGTLSSTLGATIQGLTVGRGAGAVSTNTAVGASAMTGSGGENTGIGSSALGSNTTGVQNVAVGRLALQQSTTTQDSVAVGYAALQTSSTGGYNTAVGSLALNANTTASNNTAVGYQAGYSNTTVNSNTFVGYQTGYSNTTGGVTAVGFTALYANTTGVANTAMGYRTLDANTTGGYNTAFGEEALGGNTTASNNTAVGYQAGYSNVTGTDLTAVGYQAGRANTGDYNVFVGTISGYSNTSGSGVVAVGRAALYANTTGGNNSAVGQSALSSNTTGSYNTAFGQTALTATTTASYNTAVGYQSLYTNTTGGNNLALGVNALYSNTTASNNTAVGYGSGNAITTGAKNTIIGGYSGNQGGLDIRTASNYIVLSDGDGNPRGIFDGSGNLLVGTTATSAYFDSKANFYSPATYAAFGGRQAGAANAAVGLFWHEAVSGDNLFASFLTETSPTGRGSISYNRAGGLVAYNTTSDYRAKDISGPVTGSGALIDSTPVYMGKMKDATQERPMFIAHEVPAYAHTGEKDAVDKDGKPVYQQMDASALIPVMWAELQSLRARVAQLESKP